MSPSPSPIPGDPHGRFATGLLTGLATTPFNVYSALNWIPQAVTGRHEEFLPGAYAAGQIGIDVEDYIRGKMQVPAPVTPGERAMELAGQLAFPLPVKAGPFAALLPMRQATTVGGAALEAGAAFLGGETLINALTDQQTVYDLPAPGALVSLLGMQPGGEAAKATVPTNVPSPTGSVQAPSVAAQGAVPTFSDPEPPPIQISEQLPTFSDPTDEFIPPPPDLSTEERVAKGTLGALTLLGITTGAMAFRRSRIAQREMHQVRNLSEYGNVQSEMPAVTSGSESWLKTEGLLGPKGPVSNRAATLWDSSAPIGAALDEAQRQGRITPQQSEAMAARYNTMSFAAVSAQTNAFMKTGQMPGSAIKMDVAPEAHVRKVLTLTPEEQAAYNDVRILGTVADTKRAKGAKLRAEGAKPSAIAAAEQWEGEDLATLVNKRAQLLQKYPKVAQLDTEARGMFDKFLQYIEETGLEDSAGVARMRSTNPNYHPLQRDWVNHQRSFIDNLFSSNLSPESIKGAGVDVDILKLRGDIDLKPSEVGGALDVMPRYMEDVIRAGAINKLRADFIGSLGGVRANGKALIHLNKAVPQDGSTPLMVKVKGETRYVISDDVGLINALRWQPTATVPVLGNLVRGFTAGLTGPANPKFWLGKHPIYDALTAAFTMPKQTAMGPVSRTLNHLPVLRDLLGVPVAVTEANLGVFKGVYARLLHNASLVADRALEKAPTPNKAALAQIMKDAYVRSSFNLAESSGAINTSRHSLATNRQVLEALDGVLSRDSFGGNVRQSTLYRSYMGLHDAVKDAARLQFYGANVKRKLAWKSYPVTVMGKARTLTVPAFEPDIPSPVLASQTRDLGGNVGKTFGDPSTVGGRTTQQLVGLVPYANQFIRELGAQGKAAWSNPLRYVSGVSSLLGSGLAVWAYTASTPEGLELIRSMTPEQRGRHFPVMGLDGQLKFFITVPQFFRPANAALVEGFLGSMGALEGGEYEGQQDMARAAWKSFMGDFLPDVTTPIPAVAAAMLGREFRGPNSLETSAPMQDTFDKALDTDGKVGLDQSFKLLMDALVPAAMAYVITPILDAKQAYNQGADPLAAFTNSYKYQAREAKAAGLTGIAGQVEHRGSVANMTWEKVNNITNKMEQIDRFGNPTVKMQGMFANSQLSSPEDLGGIAPNLANTPFAQVWATTKGLLKQVRQYKDQYRQLTSEENKWAKNPQIPWKDKIDTVNSLKEQRRQVNDNMLRFIRDGEKYLSAALGTEFSYEDFEIPQGAPQ